VPDVAERSIKGGGYEWHIRDFEPGWIARGSHRGYADGKLAKAIWVRVTRGAGSGQHLASVLQEDRENANIDAGLGFIWEISAQILAKTVGCCSKASSGVNWCRQNTNAALGRGSDLAIFPGIWTWTFTLRRVG
jgi:hypothetical protein